MHVCIFTYLYAILCRQTDFYTVLIDAFRHMWTSLRLIKLWTAKYSSQFSIRLSTVNTLQVLSVLIIVVKRGIYSVSCYVVDLL